MHFVTSHVRLSFRSLAARFHRLLPGTERKSSVLAPGSPMHAGFAYIGGGEDEESRARCDPDRGQGRSLRSQKNPAKAPAKSDLRILASVRTGFPVGCFPAFGLLPRRSLWVFPG